MIEFQPRPNKALFAEEISEKCNVSPIVAQVMATRNMLTAQDAYIFMHPSYELLSDPMRMANVPEVVAYLKTISKETRIRIIGDYDVDGVVGSYILYRGLQLLGFYNVDIEIPERKDGYGFKPIQAYKANKDGVELVITVDNGATAKAAIDCCEMPVIVLDHHEVPLLDDGTYDLPNATYVVDPCILGEESTEYLCGAGVVYYVLRALIGDTEELIHQLLPLTAIATIADVVPLLRDNRILVKEGLKLLPMGANVGLQCLFDTLDINVNNIRVYDIGFHVGPAINAAGRLATPRHALNLLMTPDRVQGLAYSTALKEINEERQALTYEGYDIAVSQLETDSHIIVTALPNKYAPVAGIIAGRLKSNYLRPALVMCESEDGQVLTGSGRSIETFNLYDELSGFTLFRSFGGHKAACGFSLYKDNLSALKLFTATLDDKVEIDKNIIYYDAEVKPQQLTFGLANELKLLEPVGQENPTPTLFLSHVRLYGFKRIGKEQQYLSMLCEPAIKTLMWKDVDEFLDALATRHDNAQVQRLFDGTGSVTVDMAVELSLNTFRNNTNLQLTVRGVKEV